MKLKTPAGIAEPMPLSDLQQNNKKLNNIFYLGIVGFIYLLLMTGYIIMNDVLGNVLRTLGC